MQYVFKNLIGFIRHYTGIFVLIVVCQIVCILLSFFSFGVYQNFRNEANMIGEGETAEFEGFRVIAPQAELPEKYMLSPEAYDGLYKEIGEVLGDKLDNIYIEARSPSSIYSFDFAFVLQYSNGDMIFYDEFYNNMIKNKMWVYGRQFTKSEYINGDRVCLAPADCSEEFVDTEPLLYGQELPEFTYYSYKRGDKWYLDIEGVEYECIGFHSFGNRAYYLPYKNLPDDIYIIDFPSAELTVQLTADEFEQVVNIYEEYFPGVDFQFYPLTLIDNEVLYYYNTNMWISVLISVISAVNLALIMNYILTRRRRTLAIFRITGCSANKARQIYVAEIMLVLNVLFAICLAAWVLWILPALDGIFKYMQGAFSAKIYLYIYLLYMLISYVIMNIMTARYIRREPIDLLKAR